MTASYSQAGQDVWVMNTHRQRGYFVDVGAHDGVTHSNTYALEKIGWDGLCIEPNHDAYQTLTENRRCLGSASLVSKAWGMKPFDGVRVAEGHEKMLAAPLKALLDMANAPTVIGYLSIDVEGHELEVLAGMDFDRWRVELITIEHNLYCDGPARKEAIYAHLTGHGFERVREDVVAPGYGPYEDWYVNRA